MADGERLISLDVFRGMTIAGMVLVNNPGTWSHIYDPLEHASWHGLTPTDWIFPFFLFIVGIAISIALGRNPIGSEGVSRSAIYRKIFTRAVVIFGLGASMSVIPFFQFAATDAPDGLKMLIWLVMTAGLFCLLLRNFKLAGLFIGLSIIGIIGMNLGGYNVVAYNFGTMRIPGVLQRIAVCYLITSLILLHTTWRQQVGISVVLLLGYWLVMSVIPVPGCEVTTVDDKACNLAAWLDRTILTENHIWRSAKVFDPEGILSTIPAVVTTISGVLTGTWLKQKRDDLDKVSGLFFFGVVLFAAGWVWNSYFPFNKALWTSSYVLVTSGLALFTLGFCYWLIDIRGYKAWAKPFVIFGLNPLTLFVFSGIMARMLGAYRVAGADGQPVAVQKWIFDNIFLAIAQPVDASLMYAISFILLWLVLMWLLFRKGVYVKV